MAKGCTITIIVLAILLAALLITWLVVYLVKKKDECDKGYYSVTLGDGSTKCVPVSCPSGYHYEDDTKRETCVADT